ncbi:hypothetical protein [Streptomyces mirabilis]
MLLPPALAALRDEQIAQLHASLPRRAADTSSCRALCPAAPATPPVRQTR